MANFLKKIFRFFLWKKFIKINNFKIDTWYFVLNYGIGDTYIISAFLPYLLENNQKVCVIIEKKNQLFIPSLFNEKIDSMTGINIPYYLLEEFGKHIRGQPIILHPINIKQVNILNLIGYNNINLADIYKIMLGIDMNSKPCKPNFNKSYAVQAKKIVEKFIDNDKSVLLCPQANSIDLLDENFWLKLATYLKSVGYNPVFMNDNFGLLNFAVISFPLEYSNDICNLIGRVISLRSGFCDLISNSTAVKIILYPDKQWYSGALIDGASINKMFLSDKPLFEIVIDTNKSIDFDFSKISSLLS